MQSPFTGGHATLRHELSELTDVPEGEIPVRTPVL